MDPGRNKMAPFTYKYDEKFDLNKIIDILQDNLQTIILIKHLNPEGTLYEVYHIDLKRRVVGVKHKKSTESGWTIE